MNFNAATLILMVFALSSTAWAEGARVAGDHGEPIAMFIQVGSYLVPNNLSANAHGNGYTDPNIFVADAIESVQVDGRAFNVREGNHALNLAAVHLRPFGAERRHDFDAALTRNLSLCVR